MDIRYIHQDQFNEETTRKAKERLKRIQSIARANRIKDSKKESENTKQDSTAEVVIKQKMEENSSATIELIQKASKIADRYEAQKYMEGQHSGNIEKLRSSLNNNISDKEAIEKVKQNERNKQKATEAYEKSAKYKETKQTTFEEER